MRRPSRQAKIAAGVVAIATTLAACSSSHSKTATDSSSAAAPTGASSSTTAASPAGASSATSAAGTPVAGSSLKGQKITVWAAQDPFLTPLAPLVKNFETQTGATVDFQVLGNETAYYSKLQLTLASHSGPDLFFAPTPLIGQYKSLGADTIDPLLADTTKTTAAWNYNDFPASVRQQCQLDGTTYCLPVDADTTMLYYNKAHFAAAGINGPPQSMDELVADAAKLTTADHAGFCTRAAVDQSNYFTGQMMMLYYLPYNDANKGTFLDGSWKPQLSTPQALAFADSFKKLEVQYGPKGIAGYGYQECERDLNQGKVSMFWETSAFAADVIDPTKSTQAKNIGFQVIPCPPSSNGHCTMGSPWGIYLNKASKAKDAAWQLMQFLTSVDTESKVVATGQNGVALRTSVAATAFSGNNPVLPAELGTAIAYGLSHLHAHPFPPLPNLIELLTPFGQALSNIVSGQGSPSSAMNQANSAATQVLKRAGKL
jgi:multiple sugar transport system substrate-binding protein